MKVVDFVRFPWSKFTSRKVDNDSMEESWHTRNSDVSICKEFIAEGREGGLFFAAPQHTASFDDGFHS